VPVMNIVQTRTDQLDKKRDWTWIVHVVPNLGRRGPGAGTALRDLAVDDFGKRRGLNSTGLAGKDADIEVTEESGTAAVGVIGTRQSESLDEKLRGEVERSWEHSSPVEPQGSHSILAGRTSERHRQLHTDPQVAQDREVVPVPAGPWQLLERHLSFSLAGEALWLSVTDCCQKIGRFCSTSFLPTWVSSGRASCSSELSRAEPRVFVSVLLVPKHQFVRGSV
jgi:hypothetical protein